MLYEVITIEGFPHQRKDRLPGIPSDDVDEMQVTHHMVDPLPVDRVSGIAPPRRKPGGVPAGGPFRQGDDMHQRPEDVPHLRLPEMEDPADHRPFVGLHVRPGAARRQDQPKLLPRHDSVEGGNASKRTGKEPRKKVV